MSRIKMDDIIAKTQIQASNSEKKEQDMPDHKKDFGHEAEDIVAHILKSEGKIVEEVEKGTKTDDHDKKVDIWVKFYGIAEPLGIQMTISGNENTIDKKIDVLEKRGWMARREKTEGSKIDWTGEVNVLIVKLEKNEIVEYWRESKETGGEKLIEKEKIITAEVYRQIFEQLDHINTNKKEIYYNALKEILKNTSNKKIK